MMNSEESQPAKFLKCKTMEEAAYNVPLCYRGICSLPFNK